MSSPADRLHVVDHPGEDPPFVMMHGFPDDHHIYDHLAPLLSPRRVIAFDFFGYGQSGRAATAGEQTTPGEDLTAVLDSLALDEVVLVGHDASGPVAIEYGLEHPARVPQLVLLDTYFGHAPALRLPEMIRLFADHELAPLADAIVADQAQLLWLLNCQSVLRNRRPAARRDHGHVDLAPVLRRRRQAGRASGLPNLDRNALRRSRRAGRAHRIRAARDRRLPSHPHGRRR